MQAIIELRFLSVSAIKFFIYKLQTNEVFH